MEQPILAQFLYNSEKDNQVHIYRSLSHVYKLRLERRYMVEHENTVRILSFEKAFHMVFIFLPLPPLSDIKWNGPYFHICIFL